jgi:hypothetical protein
MKTVSPNSPVYTHQGYGMTGMTVRLNLQQCQKLSNLYHSISNKEVKTDEEEAIHGFLEVFKNVNVPNNMIWNNLLESEPKVEAEAGI